MQNVIGIYNRGAYPVNGSPDKYYLEFDGVDEYVDLGRITSTEGATNFSVSFWCKIAHGTGPEFVLGRFTSANTSFYINKQESVNNNVISMTIGSGASYGVAQLTTPIPNDIWTNYTMVFDGSLSGTARLKIYENGIDGSATHSPSMVASINTNTTNMFMGAIGGAASSNMLGGLTDVAFYNYSLSSAQALLVYNNGNFIDLTSVSGLTSPIHFYRNGDGDTYPTIGDKGSLGSNNGTMVNMEPSDIKLIM